MKKIHDDLAGFIDAEDLSIGHEACQWRCKETILCPYEENGLDMNCRACIDQYLDQEENTVYYNKRIRFIDTTGRLRFTLPDGQFIKLTAGNGEKTVVLCNFVSDKVAAFDGKHMDIQLFISQMDKEGIIIEPLKD